MKTYTNKSFTQKIIIIILTVILLSFSIPKPVEAVGGLLLSPITAVGTTLLDAIQQLLENFMLGESEDFMKGTNDTSSYEQASGDGYTKKVEASNIDGSIWGLDAVNVPVIQYTPEEIFSNRVPALDINFISPSVKTGNTQTDQERNVALKLRPVISSWYIAIRTLAVVGLLSVLIYLGIRMLLTSVAADKAKYKKMLMDWLIAMCLIFTLHYIMSLTLTLTETITSLITSNGANGNGSVNVEVVDDSGNVKYSFKGNLMSYVRFMVQQKDPKTRTYFLFPIFNVSYICSKIYMDVLKKGCKHGIFNINCTNSCINLPNRQSFRWKCASLQYVDKRIFL